MTTLKKLLITIIGLFALSVFVTPHTVFADTDIDYSFVPLFGFPGGLEALLFDDSVDPIYAKLSGSHKEKIASLDAPKPAIKKAYRRILSVARIHPVVATAYSSTIDQTDSDPCSTANGFNVCKHNAEDVIAANYLPLGTRVRLPDLYGDRIFTVQDRMNARYGTGRIDLWMKTRQAAKQFGVKRTTMEVVADELAAAL